MPSSLTCPTCGTDVLDSDRFCEGCGQALTTSPNSARQCRKCEAIGAIDADGFCLECGFRNLEVDDRLEIICSPHLGGVSDPGLCHSRNEDFLVLEEIDVSVEQKSYVLVVCDGVSSSQDPQQASQVAAASACQTLAQPGTAPEERLKAAITNALTAVSNLPYAENSTDPPSTTIVAAIVEDKTATIAWLGDSRAYWISTTGSQQLTTDHSWMAQMVESQRISETEALLSPQAHAITRWLGADAREDAEPEVVQFALPGAGYLLLCSDGLWNYASDPAQIAALVLPSTANAAIIAHTLADFARSQGGHDNITVAIFHQTDSSH